MHQLRGRVGRSNLQAYALLLHPPRSLLSEVALKRMRALEKSQDLGAGYQIAQSDLKLRGAGNVFGTAQKGVSAVGQIGLDMYLETLQRAMKYLQVLFGTPSPSPSPSYVHLHHRGVGRTPTTSMAAPRNRRNLRRAF